MNQAIIIGRLTADPEVRYTQSQMAVATFTVAISRGKDKDGKDKGADFPKIIVLGKQAENCERYLEKGRLVGIQGRIQTGSYENKEGKKVYTTEVVADRVEFLEWGEKTKSDADFKQAPDAPEGFMALEDDVPF